MKVSNSIVNIHTRMRPACPLPIYSHLSLRARFHLSLCALPSNSFIYHLSFRSKSFIIGSVSQQEKGEPGREGWKPGRGWGAGGMATQVRCCFGPLTKTTTRYRPFQKLSTSNCDMQKFWNWGAINILSCVWCNSPTRSQAPSLLSFLRHVHLDVYTHAQTPGRTPLNE